MRTKDVVVICSLGFFTTTVTVVITLGLVSLRVLSLDGLLLLLAMYRPTSVVVNLLYLQNTSTKYEIRNDIFTCVQ